MQFKVDDKVMTNKGLGVVVSVNEDGRVAVFIDGIPSSSLPGQVVSFTHIFNKNEVKLYDGSPIDDGIIWCK
jgi:hypothetical protein